MRNYYVYMMTNKSGTLYVGVTNNLERRVSEHKQGLPEGFTSRYKMDRLVYFELYPTPRSAIEREKQIKGWLRKKKFELIRSMNPTWRDLSAEWFEDGQTLRFAQGDVGRRR